MGWIQTLLCWPLLCRVLYRRQLWISFGHGGKMRFIPAHEIATKVGGEYAWGLLFMHAFTGFDASSAFHGIGKKTAWNVMMNMPSIRPVMSRLSHASQTISEADMDEVERFVVLLYQRTSPISKVNDARKHLFATGNRLIENIPPTRDALMLHVKRSTYQAGYIWGQTLLTTPQLPSPSEWGWEKLGTTWTPCWSTLPTD